MTGFTKTIPKAQEVKSKLQLYIEATYTQALSRHTKNMAVDGQVCFYRQLFVDLVKPQGCTTRPLVPLRGTNKTVGRATLLPTTVWAYPVMAVYVDYWMYSTAVCVQMEGTTHLQLPTHPSPLPPIHPLYMLSVILQQLKKTIS